MSWGGVTRLDENVKWQTFKLSEICEILSGQDIYERERVLGETPYITATANNNGIGYFVDNSNKTLEQNCISINRNGSVGYAFYHPYSALYGNDTRKLRPKFQANKYISLFITMCLEKQRTKYGYGYKMGTARLKQQKILLPTADNSPDWQFMENYIKQIELAKVQTILKYYC
ncbi:restriction endonuclease subunit S [Lonepinella sp. BR2882]|uniref:restriction endonuclease subunit S n=1 Tax=Lonepinella sp. BR2882 TaxID=3095283 RepID=UPI003F6E08F3